MKLVIRKKTTAEWLALYVLILPFFFSFLMEFLPLPSIIKYTVDIAWLCLLALILIRRNLRLDGPARHLLYVVGLFFLMTIVGLVLNYQSILYYLWGLRNNLRFFVFFFACILFMQTRTAASVMKFFDFLLWVNLPIVLYQYVFMGKDQDRLGGIFGVESGCNGYMNIFLIIVITRSILLYLQRKESMPLCFAKCAVALLIAVFAEMKAFFLELVIVAVMAVLITRFSWKKLWIILVISVGVVTGAQLVERLFPEFADWFRWEKIWESLSSEKGYTSQGDMNRMTAISIAMERFLTDGWQKIFGLGLGNCDYATFDFLTTPFYRMYHRLNYVWFSSSFLILETGFAGLLLYGFFFVRLFFAARKEAKQHKGRVIYAQMAQILSAVCILLMIYNVSLRTESGYMMFFALALPFLGKADETRTIKKKAG